MSHRGRNPELTQSRLVEAVIRLMVRQGYAATTVDQICEEAGLTKGAFFHHFGSKEELARAGVVAWGKMGTALYEEAWTGEESDPLRQLERMFEIMESFTQRPDEPCVCMVGMMAQELGGGESSIREACAVELRTWTGQVARLLGEAKRMHRVTREFDPDEAAWFLNGVWQGSMLVGKACAAPSLIRQNLRIARAWVMDHFESPTHQAQNKS